MGRPEGTAHIRAVLSVAPGECDLAVGAEGHGLYPAVVSPSGRDEGLARDRVPEPRRPVGTAGQDHLAVGAEGRGPARASTFEDKPDRLEGLDVPDAYRGLTARCE